MIELLEKILAPRVEESSIDFPQADLDSSVWDKKGETYTIKPEVKNKILEIVKRYPKFPLLEIAKEIHIVGSIATNQFLSDADLDIHVVPDVRKLRKYLKDKE